MRLIALLLTAMLSMPALAHDADKDGIHIADPWIKAPIGQGKVAAAYLSVIDMDGDGDRLLSVKSDIAARIELHTHIQQDGIMRMRPMENAEVSSMEVVDFVPGGHHIMLMGLNRKLAMNEKITLTLVFETVGEIPVDFTVLKSEPE